MNRVKRTILTALALALSVGAWAQTPGEVTLTPVTGQTNQWTLTMPAGNVELQVDYVPIYTATFKPLTKHTIQDGKAALALDGSDTTLDSDGKLNGLYAGQTINLTAARGYKLRNVVAGPSVENPVLGQVIGSDGKNYDANSLPAGVTAMAVIAYINTTGSNSLAIALTDEVNNMTWANAKTACESKTPAGSLSWHMPSEDEWHSMFTYDEGVYLYVALNNLITAAGGSGLISGGEYWTSDLDPNDESKAVYINILAAGIASTIGGTFKDSEFRVRAVLAF